jgi:dTDP-4-dehydrorhamnose reductase
MAKRDEIKVVADQRGTPTHARNLARVLWRLAADVAPGIHHFTDEGETTWHGFALAIRDEARSVGLITRNPDIIAVTTSDYPTPARRPAYSVLDKGKIHAKFGMGQDWRAALKDMLLAKKNQA